MITFYYICTGEDACGHEWSSDSDDDCICPECGNDAGEPFDSEEDD